MMVKYVPVEAPAIVSGHLYLDQHYKFNSVLHKFRGGNNSSWLTKGGSIVKSLLKSLILFQYF